MDWGSFLWTWPLRDLELQPVGIVLGRLGGVLGLGARVWAWASV